MSNLQQFKLLKRVENLATGILGHKVIASFTEKGTSSKISDNPAKTPSKIFINPGQLSVLDSNQIRAVIFHEVGHHLYSPILDVKTPVDSTFIEIMEEIRMEFLLYKYVINNFSDKMAKAILQLRYLGFQSYHQGIFDKLRTGEFLTKKNKHQIFLQFILVSHLITARDYEISLEQYLRDFLRSSMPDFLEQDTKDIVKALKLWIKALSNLNTGDGTSLYSDFLHHTWSDFLLTTSLENMILKTEKIWPELKKLLNWPEEKQKKGIAVMQSHPIPGGLGTGNDASEKQQYEISEFDTMTAKTLGHHIKTVLLNRKMTRFAFNQKRGKLHTAQAYKITKDNFNVFKVRQERSKDLNYTIGFALDTSGSMNDGEKFPYAMQGTYLLAEACKQAKIKLYLSSFNGSVTDYKDYTEMLKMAWAGGDNNIKKAVENLITKPTEPNSKRIDLIVSDGVDSTISMEYLKETEQRTNRRIIGIGLGLRESDKNWFLRNFHDYVMVDNPAELPGAFISLCKKILL